MDCSNKPDFKRRAFMISGTASAAATVLPVPAGAASIVNPVNKQVDAPQRALFESVSLSINGQVQVLEKLDNRTTLLDALREHLYLTGSKKGCDHGQCGACTVLVNGIRINACLSLAVMHQNDEVTTIKGLGTPAKLHPMQAAFVKHDVFQCGYCTPGQICSAVAVLKEFKAGIPCYVTADLTSGPKVTGDEIRERMSGNICRCGAYSNIVDAIMEVADASGGSL